MNCGGEKREKKKDEYIRKWGDSDRI